MLTVTRALLTPQRIISLLDTPIPSSEQHPPHSLTLHFFTHGHIHPARGSLCVWKASRVLISGHGMIASIKALHILSAFVQNESPHFIWVPARFWDVKYFQNAPTVLLPCRVRAICDGLSEWEGQNVCSLAMPSKWINDSQEAVLEWNPVPISGLWIASQGHHAVHQRDWVSSSCLRAGCQGIGT